MERVIGLVNKLQQICTSLGDNALSPHSILWNRLPTIVVVGGQVRCLNPGHVFSVVGAGQGHRAELWVVGC